MKEQTKKSRASPRASMKPSAAYRTLWEAFEAEKARDLVGAVRRFKRVAQCASRIALSKSDPRMHPKAAYQMMLDAASAEYCGHVSTATRLYKEAARTLSNIARSALGTIYSDELNPPEVLKAIYWYKSGVKNGDPLCAWNLAMQYAKMGRRRGYLHWLAIAEEMGDEDAPVELADNFWWNKNNSKLARTTTRSRKGRAQIPFRKNRR